jgi:rod shape-determining protein MreB
LKEELDVQVKGSDLLTGIPTMKTVSSIEIREQALYTPIQTIINSIINLLVSTPPELAKDIYDRGIWLSGGGALLHGLDKRIERETQLKVSIPDEPLLAVANGTGKVLDKLNDFRTVLLKHIPYL